MERMRGGRGWGSLLWILEKRQAGWVPVANRRKLIHQLVFGGRLEQAPRFSFSSPESPAIGHGIDQGQQDADGDDMKCKGKKHWEAVEGEVNVYAVAAELARKPMRRMVSAR